MCEYEILMDLRTLQQSLSLVFIPAGCKCNLLSMRHQWGSALCSVGDREEEDWGDSSGGKCHNRWLLRELGTYQMLENFGLEWKE